jgi:hypothetical protein
MEGELKAMFETLKREPEYAWIFDKYERLKNAPVMHHVGDCDGGYRFMVFPKSSTDDYIYEVLKLYGITWDDFFPQSHYAHAGAYYTEQAELIKKGGRILFKQFEGYNV